LIDRLLDLNIQGYYIIRRILIVIIKLNCVTIELGNCAKELLELWIRIS